MQTFHFLLALATALPAQACFEHALKERMAAGAAYKRSMAPPDYVKTAIKNVHVFDGEQMLPPQTVVIDGDKISEDHDGVQKTIDGEGGYLIPGLIDSHAHPQSIHDLEIYSSWGVTAVRNMACYNYTLCRSLQNQTGLTTLFTAGYPTQGPNSTHATVNHTPPDHLIYNASQAPEMVAWTFGNGSDYFKITSEEPHGPTQDEQNALVAETHKRGKQAMTHAAAIVPFSMAIHSKTNGIQHTPADGYFNSSLLDKMKAQGQFHTATLFLITAFQSNPKYLAISGYNMTSMPIAAKNVQIMKEAGVTQLIGTDAIGVPNSLNVTSPFGSSLHDELANFVNLAGFSPAEALQAATVIPSRVQHGLEGRGQIKPGMRADLVLLGSDPLCNISNTRDIKKVWNGGLEYNGGLNMV